MQNFCNHKLLNPSIPINQFHFLTNRKFGKGFAREVVVSQQSYISILGGRSELRHFSIMAGNVIGIIVRLLNNRECQGIRNIYAPYGIRFTALNRVIKSWEIRDGTFRITSRGCKARRYEKGGKSKCKKI